MKRNNKLYPVILLFVLIITTWYSQAQETTNIGKFQQLKQELLTPNVYRTASGTPGPHYWQQKVDYKISILLDETTQRIYGEETIIYNNNSPDDLNYLWVQLDQNVRAKNSLTACSVVNQLRPSLTAFNFPCRALKDK